MLNIRAFKKIKKNLQPHTNIIAITKKKPIEAIESAIYNNLFLIGENQVQETEKKYKNFKQRKKIKLHLIGHLQTNKVKKAISLFDVIQTVDSLKLLNKINQEAKKQKKTQTIYLQINISKDKNKHGILEEEIKSYYHEIKKNKNVKLKGIMTILNQTNTTKTTKNEFIKTKQLQRQIQKEITSCKEVSMGMSKDYSLASKSGATQVRIGTILFGKRK